MILESRDFAVIIAITEDNKIIMIRQWRYAMGHECLELPAGSANTDESILVTAKRELQEEAGATSDDWQEIKSYWLGNGAMRIKGHIFLAKNARLSEIINNDDTEKTIVETYTYPELMDMVNNNIINDERSLLSLLLLEKYL
jgi:ADP-ribose pyrophosphatase